MRQRKLRLCLQKYSARNLILRAIPYCSSVEFNLCLFEIIIRLVTHLIFVCIIIFWIYSLHNTFLVNQANHRTLMLYLQFFFSNNIYIYNKKKKINNEDALFFVLTRYASGFFLRPFTDF
jgi:hypothetical protein